jgi:hypothetical protein
MSATRGHPLADVAGTYLLFRFFEIPASVGRLTRGLFEILRRVLLSMYLRRYFGSSVYRREQLDDWVPLMAAAYLGQGLTPQEDDRLIALIEAALGG